MHRGLLSVAIVLLVLWVVGWLFFKTVGAVIHLLLLAALVFIVWSVVKRGARAVGRRL